VADQQVGHVRHHTAVRIGVNPMAWSAEVDLGLFPALKELGYDDARGGCARLGPGETTCKDRRGTRKRLTR